MNKQAARLEPLAEHAGRREAEAARSVAASNDLIQAKEAELEQLRAYLAEYRQRADLESKDSTRWQNTRAFLARLVDAVAFHEAELRKLIENHRFATERWQDSHRKAKALDHVIERSQREYLGMLQRRDQAELDELAARRTTYLTR